MRRTILCHFHEVALKKKNRAFFEEHLCRNLRSALKGLPYLSVQRRFGRVLVNLPEGQPSEPLEERIRHVFGIVSYAPAWICPTDLGEIQSKLWKLVQDRQFETFKIHSRRADKNFPVKSPELNRILGSWIESNSGRKVRLESPDLTCYVHIVGNSTYLYFDRHRGAGGLPVGSGGKVVVLLSGGIDSPVAAYKILKRGCRAVFVHFHSYPHTTLESQDKVRQLARILNRYQYVSRLYLVPFGETQRHIIASTPPETRVILYRRMMVRLAEKIAHRERAAALVTGDSIGQVASQTLENLHVVNCAAGIPILRPLIGDDKEDIIQLAQQIGTFDTSVLPDQDCCTLFVPKHPETRARLADIERFESALDIDSMTREARRGSEMEKIVGSAGY